MKRLIRSGAISLLTVLMLAVLLIGIFASMAYVGNAFGRDGVLWLIGALVFVCVWIKAWCEDI